MDSDDPVVSASKKSDRDNGIVLLESRPATKTLIRLFGRGV